MKRNMEVIIRILERLEEAADVETIDKKEEVSMEIEGIEKSKINYHLYLLLDTNLIEFGVYNQQRSAYKPLRLTWAGHDYLDHLREKYGKIGRSGVH